MMGDGRWGHFVWEKGQREAVDGHLINCYCAERLKPLDVRLVVKQVAIETLDSYRITDLEPSRAEHGTWLEV